MTSPPSSTAVAQYEDGAGRGTKRQVDADGTLWKLETVPWERDSWACA